MRTPPETDENMRRNRPPGAWNRSVGAALGLLKDQRVLFLIVGGINTLFSTALFAALVTLFGPGVPSAVSLCISWLVSLLLVFAAYRRWVFKVKGRWLTDLMRFASVNLVALLANAFALTALVEGAGLPPIPVQVVLTVLIVVFNYVGHKYFSFRRKRGDGQT